MADERDPGWAPALRRGIPYLLVPFMPLVRLLVRRRTALDGITELRIVFLHYVWSLILLLVVVMFVAEGWGAGSPLWAPIVLVGYAILSLGMLLWFRARPLVPTSPAALAGSYRTIFFVQIAFAIAPALMGLAGVFILGGLWPYVVGLLASALGLALAAPTTGEIDCRQRQVISAGSSLSLADALSRPPPTREEARRMTRDVRDYWRRGGGRGGSE